MRWMGVLLMVIGVACGGGRSGPPAAAPGTGAGTASTPTGNDTTHETATPSSLCNGVVTMRVRATDVGTLTAFDLDVQDVSVRAGATDVVVSSEAHGALALVGADSYRLGVIPWPSSAVQATLVLAGVHAAGVGFDDQLAICTAPITFTIDPNAVDPTRCHVVLHVDATASLQQDPWGALTFLPRFSVHY